MFARRSILSRTVQLAAATLLAPTASRAQVRSPMFAASSAAKLIPLSPGQKLERRFLQITAANTSFESDAARLVPTHSSNPAVKEIAKLELEREKTAQPELLRLLQARGMAMPFHSGEHNKVLKQLAKLNGAKFDRLYIDEVVLRSNQADVQNFERMATEAEDPVLKAWVERRLPDMRDYLAKAGRALPGTSVRG